MTKEQYKKAMQAIRVKQNALSDQIVELQETYIKINKPCEINEEVTIEHRNGNTTKGIVVDFKVTFWDDVEPTIKRIKKDGKASNRNIFIWTDDKIHYPIKSEA